MPSFFADTPGHTRSNLRKCLPAFAAMLVGLAASYVNAAEAQPVRQISVSGAAERKVMPDVALVNVTVNALSTKVEAAKAEHDKKLKSVIDIAKAEGIEEAQIKTQHSSIQPQTNYENNKRIFKGYNVQTALTLKVKKIETLGTLLEKLTTARLETGTPEWQSLVNVSYGIDNPDKLRDDMLADAIKNARSKAEKMAAAAGSSVGRVLSINEGSIPSFNMPPMPMMARATMEAAAPKAAIAPPPGEQEVSAGVTVTFELKD